jgi:hypothetical protein
VADRPLRPATDRRLGRLLPHQQANRTQATPKAPRGFAPQDICGISPSFPGLSPTSGHIPTRYSPVRHSPRRACDLHVLSIPPAFALSQDQTLRFISAAKPKAQPRRSLPIRLRSPLSMQCTLQIQARPTPPQSRDSIDRQVREHLLASKRHIRLSENRSPFGTKPTRGQPASLRGKELVPEGTKNRICSRAALDFQKPQAAPEGTANWPERSNRSAAGCPT